MNIQGHAALVTGGGSGLGEATARELARLGAKVAVLDVNIENAQRVAAEIGGMAIRCDVTSPESMQAAIEQAAAAHGTARILMQIAGIGSAKRVVGKDGNVIKRYGSVAAVDDVSFTVEPGTLAHKPLVVGGTLWV